MCNITHTIISNTRHAFLLPTPTCTSQMFGQPILTLSYLTCILLSLYTPFLTCVLRKSIPSEGELMRLLGNKDIWFAQRTYMQMQWSSNITASLWMQIQQFLYECNNISLLDESLATGSFIVITGSHAVCINLLSESNCCWLEVSRGLHLVHAEMTTNSSSEMNGFKDLTAPMQLVYVNGACVWLAITKRAHPQSANRITTGREEATRKRTNLFSLSSWRNLRPCIIWLFYHSWCFSLLDVKWLNQSSI